MTISYYPNLMISAQEFVTLGVSKRRYHQVRGAGAYIKHMVTDGEQYV